MGFGGSINLMVDQSINYAAALMADFWPLISVFVGLWALAFIISIIKS